jgi:hypothetical protein
MASLKKCIEQKCKDCTYDHAAPGTWREQTELCTVRACALWPVRPMTVATITLNRKTRIGGSEELNIDALVDALPDDEEEEVA